jgi:hypothetical protein
MIRIAQFHSIIYLLSKVYNTIRRSSLPTLSESQFPLPHPHGQLHSLRELTCPLALTLFHPHPSPCPIWANQVLRTLLARLSLRDQSDDFYLIHYIPCDPCVYPRPYYRCHLPLLFDVILPNINCTIIITTVAAKLATGSSWVLRAPCPHGAGGALAPPRPAPLPRP